MAELLVCLLLSLFQVHGCYKQNFLGIIAHGVEPLTLYKTSVQESDIMCTHFAADETSYLFECELSNKTLIASVVRKEPAPSEEALTAALALTLPGVSILPIQVGLTLVCRGNLPSEYNYSLIFLK